MSACCRTCDHRNHAVRAFPSAPSQLGVCIVTLSFNDELVPISSLQTALNATLNDILDSIETTSYPTSFTSWSPCLSDPRIAVIVSTARETCAKATSPVFDSIRQHLAIPPTIQHIYLDYSVLSLAASSPDERVPVDIIQLQAPTPGLAATIGKHFGWDPKRSSLSAQLASCASPAFSHPGDLVKDFWAWAELGQEYPLSPSTLGSSFASSHESLPRQVHLRNCNSDEKNMSLPFPEDNDEDDADDTNDETLVMIFQWCSHGAAERFKHPLQLSYGNNGEEVRRDLWDMQVAHPVRQLQGLGAKTMMYKLELRAVEPRAETSKRAEETRTRRVRGGSKRLSIMASGLSERVSGLWR